MSKKRKYAAIVGVLAMVGMGLWMRELASWRPVTVGKFDSPLWQLRISGDGYFLAAAMVESEGYDGWVIDTRNGNVDNNNEHFADFDKNHGLETFPRVQFDKTKKQLVFESTRGHKLKLESAEWESDSVMCCEPEPVDAAQSETQNEVYCNANGEIWIWDRQSGKLKKRMKTMKYHPSDTVLSPDGKWFLSVEHTAKDVEILRRYAVQGGKWVAVVDKSPVIGPIGFSANGQFLWFIRQNGNGMNLSFHVAPNTSAKIDWGLVRSQSCSGPVKWLPDGHIGIVQRDGFEWRDSSLRLLRRLPGPVAARATPKEVKDWVLSPDGKWIYSAEQSGIIRRWRAR